MTSEFGNNVDEDVVEQILSILPPKALMRFKCVSKTWYALITNPRFVAMHLSNSNSNSNSMHNNLSTTGVLLKRLVHNDTNTNETDEANTSNVTNDEAEEVISFLHFRKDHDDNDVDDKHERSFLFSIQDVNIPLSTGLKTHPESLSIIGHCNGIICLAHSISGEVVLCNPSIQEFKLLPSSPYLPDSDWQHAPLFRIVSVLGGNNLKSRDNSTPNTGFSLFKYFSLSFGHSMVEKKSHSYSVWAFPSDDMSLRIKKVMEGLRVEFGGSKIEPHITLIGSIRMTHEDVINKFRSLRSLVISSFEAKVNRVVTRSSYYQCVSLLIHSSNKVSLELSYAIGVCGGEFQFWNDVRPHLSLLYGYLTEEERKKAQERVSILDEAINSLSFPVTRLALYKIGYKDTSLRSWEKIAEYPLH
ncbi:hypothetical protein M0R45_028643 [Rubus argutus]|uniref:F-box domain-containing protein n=1 Tax=Rubus argutus TaxID=59490 RepID=A0AAW1W890_RUBAR